MNSQTTATIEPEIAPSDLALLSPLTKKELIVLMSEVTGFSQRQSTKSLNAFLGIVTTKLVAGQPVKIVGFAHFDTTLRNPRIARNPRTGASVSVAASKVVTFRPSKPLKQAVNNSYIDVASN